MQLIQCGILIISIEHYMLKHSVQNSPNDSVSEYILNNLPYYEGKYIFAWVCNHLTLSAVLNFCLIVCISGQRFFILHFNCTFYPFYLIYLLFSYLVLRISFKLSNVIPMPRILEYQHDVS